MKNFNERSFLVRALVGVFAVQFATVAYQVHSCQAAIKSKSESEKVTLVCNGATNTFNETSKLALTTFLALLVPSAAQGADMIQKTPRKRARQREEETVVEETKEEKVG